VPGKSEYCASKFALHGFSDAWRAELAGLEIDLLLVSPSTTSSEFFSNVLAGKSGQTKGMAPERVARHIVAAMKRGKHEIILSWGGRLLVWLDRIAPTLANRLLARYG
jgi:short-subunit dehydrogenase